jgi:hypothetical protein
MATAPRGTAGGSAADDFRDIAAHVHTYESFGRAIVSHVLRSITNGDGPLERRSVIARFSVRPPVARFDLHCIDVAVSIDDNTYTVSVCVFGA